MLKNKRLISIISFVLLIIMSALCFTSCGMGLDKDKANDDIIEFLRAVRNDDFKGAKQYLHPSFEDDIESFFSEVEEQLDIDLQSGITILGYFGSYYAAYTSDVDGSLYERYLEIEVSGKVYDLIVTVVENDEGYGIDRIEIEY